MSRLRIVPAENAHADALAPSLRVEDALELHASHGLLPAQALHMGIRESLLCCAVVTDSDVLAMFGVHQMVAGRDIHNIWMLSGAAVESHPIAFLRLCKLELEALLECWPVLVNAVDARYAKALRWAKWLGFEVLPPIPYGEKGLPFHPIFIRRRTWVS